MLVVDKDCDDKVYSCDEAMELTGHGRYNYLCLITSCIISISIGVDMCAFGVVVAASSCDLQLGIAETAVLASAPFTGLLFACPWGYFADARGRRLALLLSTTASFILAILSSFSTSWKVLLALKVLECAFSIGSITLVAFLGESTGTGHRSQYMFIINSFALSSQFVTFVIAYFILPLDIYLSIPWLSITFRSWRLFTLLMSVPLGAGALMMYFLQESPKFLAHMGKQEEALNVLKTIYKINHRGKTNYPVTNLIRSP